MSEGVHIERGQWPILLSLDLADPERLAAFAHAGGCPACEQQRREAVVLIDEIALLPQPAAPRPEALQRAAAAVRRVLDAENTARAQAPWVEALATLGAFGLVIGLAAHSSDGGVGAWGPSTGPLGAWGPALVLLGTAALVPWLVKRFGGWGLALAAVSVPFAIWRASDLDLALQMGASCFAMEALAALLPLAALASLARARGIGFGAWTFAAAAASGALAGQAALLLTCPSRELGHLLGIHTGTVLVAALIGAGLPKLVPSFGRG